MAVIQISKIQHRRGLKNNNAGIPQLSAAEIAWAIDTQELYIGNGSVADGAPYVGNTKILTEHDNILELANSYRFAFNDPSISLSVPRGLQTKLDEYVSIFDFGAVPDGSTDSTTFFENAFNQLFRNADPKFKKTLFIPNGSYLFSDNLRIPSNARIKGESIEYRRFQYTINFRRRHRSSAVSRHRQTTEYRNIKFNNQTRFGSTRYHRVKRQHL